LNTLLASVSAAHLEARSLTIPSWNLLALPARLLMMGRARMLLVLPLLDRGLRSFVRWAATGLQASTAVVVHRLETFWCISHSSRDEER
jgi:hypothetical protein